MSAVFYMKNLQNLKTETNFKIFVFTVKTVYFNIHISCSALFTATVLCSDILQNKNKNVYTIQNKFYILGL